MEPASIVSLVGACITLTVKSATTVRDVCDQINKIKNAHHEVDQLYSRLTIISAALDRIESWLQPGDSWQAMVPTFFKGLESSLKSCEIIMTDIKNHISGVHQGALKGKLKFWWEDSKIQGYSKALDSQVNALNLLLSTINLDVREQSNRLAETESRRILRQATDDASSYIHLSNGDQSFLTHSLAEGEDSTTIMSQTAFDFDDEIVTSDTYQKAYQRFLSDNPGRSHLTSNLGVIEENNGDVQGSNTSRNSQLSITKLNHKPSIIQTLRLKLPGHEQARKDLSTELLAAVRSGHIGWVSNVLSKGARVSHRYEDGMTVVHAAAQRCDIPVLRLLLQHGKATCMLKTDDGSSPLHYATTNAKTPDIVQLLLDHKADVNAKDKNGITPLCKATAVASQILLAAGAHTFCQCKENKTALHYALEQGTFSAEKCMQLIEHGAPVNTEDRFGNTPLHLACRGATPDRLRVLKALIDAGSDLEAESSSGMPLHIAAGWGALECVTMLLEHGANPNRYSTRGTALHIAATSKHSELMTTLLESGADIDSVLHRSKATALYLAIQSSSLSTAKFLLQHGANVNKGSDLHRPLAAAIVSKNEREALIQLLLDFKAELDVVTSARDDSALTLAIRFNRVDTVRFLLDHGADVNQRVTADSQESTPLMVAISVNNLKIARILVEHGHGNMEEEVTNVEFPRRDALHSQPYPESRKIRLKRIPYTALVHALFYNFEPDIEAVIVLLKLGSKLPEEHEWICREFKNEMSRVYHCLSSSWSTAIKLLEAEFDRRRKNESTMTLGEKV